MPLSRRSFLQGGAAAYAVGTSTPTLLASVLQAVTSNSGNTQSGPSIVTRLDTGWEFFRGPLDAPWEIAHSQDIAVWQPVTVPHCFNHYDACDPETPAYRGQGCYRKHLRIANPFPQGRTLLHFQGVGQQAAVYLGEALVGKHIGGYDEFVMDITEGAQHTPAGTDLQLAVVCDNSPDTERMPSDLSDFTLYGGLYRAVHLVYVPAISLEALHTTVSYSPGSVAKVAITARLYTPAATQGDLQLNLSVTDPSGRKVFQQTLHPQTWQGEKELAAFELKAPLLWSPDQPHLYHCEASLTCSDGTSAVAHAFGVRHTRFEEHGPFFLNGERLLLRGTQRHEDHAGYAAAMPDDLIRQELQLVKDMGANFIRLAHYQQSSLVLDLCDQLGLLVWEEVPWCRSGVGTKLFQERGRTQLRNMIDQHRNHPSVLMWGLGNEDDWPGEVNGQDKEAIRHFMQELHELSHQLDPTRMTAYRRCDFARDIPDVYSPSIWAGWYSGSYTEYRASLDKARMTVPHFMHIEWGADSHAGRHAEDPDPVLARILTGKGTAEKGLDYKFTGGDTRVSRDGEWSETYACDLFDWYLKTQEEIPWLSGSAQWIFKDFTTPLRVENPVPRVNQKGLITRDMQPKEGYFVFQSYWSKKPMLRIYGHNWPIRWGKAGQERLVRIYSNCSSVELFLNGVSLGTKKRNPQEFPAAGLHWNVAFREGKNELRAVSDGKIAGPSGKPFPLADEVAFTYQTTQWGAPKALALSLKHQALGSATIEAQMLDAAGVRCLDSRAVVRFSLAGNGKLIDNLGTPTGSRIVQLYNGRAEISLSLKDVVETSVDSDGVSTAFLRIPRS
ncbi:glycoside hydrolase family 2 TIM barrel-domain containing protein [Granulicella sp. dw_53]|uniref:glycoside hydrolase family 2 protein n=1 Tax=Granulicella sp. dw_53 TaxID=2719792 RepID=UPI001BD62D5F|nr:glycoside hydrolase family 2 TIM barrel-domain containing protein [Granulicella sp. dw_53]